MIILFQRTLEDVEHIYRAGFDMFNDECKWLCRETWEETFNYFLINRLEHKNSVSINCVMNLIQSINFLIHKGIIFRHRVMN